LVDFFELPSAILPPSKSRKILLANGVRMLQSEVLALKLIVSRLVSQFTGTPELRDAWLLALSEDLSKTTIHGNTPGSEMRVRRETLDVITKIINQ
jgi:hypothetical protein